MKLNFKKISAIAASTLLAGMSLGLAAAAAYPAPFVNNGVASSVGVVYGTGAGVASFDSSSDLLQAGNVQTSLTSAVTGGTTTITGEKQNLATSARKLYYSDSINAAYPSLSANELPSVLADGTFSDLSGTQYTYTQTITLGTTASTFGTSGGDLTDPTLYLDVGTDATAPLYNYTVSFNKNLNVSDSTNVQGQKINLLGVDYVIGSSSTNSTLYLYGSGADVTLSAGDKQSVSVGGSSVSVELVAATSTTTAKITVNGVSKTVTQGSSYSFAGDLNVYVKDVTYQSYQGGIQSVELLVGANTLKLVNGQTVKQGADETSIKNTMAYITAAGAGEISGLTVAVAAQKSQSDSLVAGDTFTDPVFGGFKLAFTGANPALDSTERGMIKVDTDNNQFARATFTSALAGSAGEQQLTYAYDNDTSSTAIAPILAHKVVSTNQQGLIHVLEGENAKQNDWIVVNSGDAGTILEVSDISIDTATSGTVTLVDAITGASQQVTLTNSSNVYTKSGVNMFGGTGYTIKAAGDGTSMNITWNSGTTAVFPRIKLADGGWIAFAQNTSVGNTTNVLFPDGLTTLGTSGQALANGTTSYVQNGINWTTDGGVGSYTKITGINGPSCSFATGPAVIFIEPKKWDDGSYGNFACVPMTTAGTTEIAVAQAVLNGTNSGFVTLTSDTYESKAVDKYGTVFTDEQRTNQNGVETISYPKSQMYLDVVATSESATVSNDALGNVIYKDTDKSSWQNSNVIIVGGSCINSAAAEALGVSPNTCGSDFTTATGIGDGEFLIKGVQDKFATGKLALVVAGYTAADTVNAVTYLTKKYPDTSKAYKGTSQTSAEVMVA